MTIHVIPQAPIRVGVVGCGVVADYGHIPAIHRCSQAVLAAFADPDPARRKVQSEKYGAPAFASMEEMVAAVALDAVTIATHPGLKLPLARVAAAHGLHAFCEKPLTENEAEAEELVGLMDAAGLLVGTAFVYRGKPIVQRMVSLLKNGAIGRLHAVMTENLWDYHGARSDAWGPQYFGRRHRALQNLGTLDCGVHHLDLARYLAGGEFSRLDAVGAKVESGSTFPDHLMIHGVMDNGVLVCIEESAVWGYSAKDRPTYEQSYRLLGDQGTLTARFDFVTSHSAELRIVSGERQWTETVPADKAWDETYGQFFDLILGGEVPNRFLADGHDALVNMRVARQVLRQCDANGMTS